ncbi:MAG TPA: hypothetical protein CFH84_10840 [Sulfurimonas sp. UBA12504]|nr:MAG: hypothetical protein A2019_06490 [Sulfurimonas sp. GWF2_37_8]DAB29208.1 MAG TPA: hypothetical protein CFH84_10840 [Sulfurimonas sp. UBA12504]
MIYFVIALKSEAQAFVDKYKLSKENAHGFLLFKSANMRLIVSGMGVQNARFATQTLINLYDISDEDIFVNVGICGAEKSYAIGECLTINAIEYENHLHRLTHTQGKTISCVDTPILDGYYELVDMESFGFFDAVMHSPAIKNIYIFKVVSNHFEPQKVSRDGAKNLIFKAIGFIEEQLTHGDECS